MRGEVGRSTQTRIELAFTSTYSVEGETWLVEASSPALGLDFGLWEVSDTTQQVAPEDGLAQAIASRDTVCDQPSVFLATGPTPLAFPTPTPSPTPTSSPVATPVVATGEQARLRVWLAV